MNTEDLWSTSRRFSFCDSVDFRLFRWFCVRLFVEQREQIEEEGDVREHVIDVNFREVTIETNQSHVPDQDDYELNLKNKKYILQVAWVITVLLQTVLGNMIKFNPFVEIIIIIIKKKRRLLKVNKILLLYCAVFSIVSKANINISVFILFMCVIRYRNKNFSFLV